MDLFADDATLNLEQALLKVFEDYVQLRAAASPAAPRTVRPLREESAAVYRDVWGSFARFYAGRGVDLARLSFDDVDGFVTTLGDGTVEPRYVRRVLALIERVARFAAQRDGYAASGAPAALMRDARYRYADAALEEERPEFLTSSESARLIAYVTAPRPDPRADTPWRWLEVRDRTSIALQLGAGITPGEVLTLGVADVVVDGGAAAGVPWKMRLPANGNSPAHESPLAPWAGRQLARWLTVRLEAQVQGERVFVSKRSGKPWSKESCYDAGQAVLQAAGVHSGGGGTYRLRHTFVLRQMANGKSEQAIANYLGLKDPRSMARYRRVLATPVAMI